MKRILIATGGTGGHVFPASALGEKLKKRGYSVHYTVDVRGAKYDALPQGNTYLLSIDTPPAGKLSKLYYYFKLIFVVLKMISLVKKIRPDVVIGFGGYASFPIVFASSLVKGVKIILHESNAVIGKANEWLLSRARYLATGFSKIDDVANSQKKKISFTGTPVRQEIIDARNSGDLIKDSEFKILIFGGSQAASILTEFVPKAIVALPDEFKKKIKVFHQCKASEVKELQDYYIKNHIDCDVKYFFHDMHIKYSEASMVIARAGASTISELVATGVPAILIPLKNSAKNHQYLNASYFSSEGCGRVVTEDELKQGQLAKELFDFISDKKAYFAMKAKLAEINIDWEAKIVNLIEN
jgi:UDP-N-acetylglucosamine--N-acetylmuramyl-(pentapeptide) pyrophosphoryl-undecaprenol N-acetylglucosamine transferase